MKTTPYALLAVAFLFLFGSCEKDNMNPGSKKKPGSPTATEKAIPSVTVSVSGSCGARICNAIEIMPNPPRYNMLTMTKSAGPTGITYSLYERTTNSGGLEVYTRYAQFPCSLGIVQYASGLVNNGAATLVCSTDSGTSTLPPVNIVYFNGVMATPPADTDFDLITAGNEEGAGGCGDPNG